ncbi:universal stress protein [Myxococcus sp. RHSTA-1-4]|uniref:universal stress protein n=1 Tax=Myxococcus sp. RHSTA-1-4 TaxID=2874601 RepID=UPI001CBC244B|nr:universal stress protein [Myxococcus sp. RHSTA-1-4]MBZ4421062.1 universal stress protein [Myxococcus sp. RHSTA-1-4]
MSPTSLPGIEPLRRVLLPTDFSRGAANAAKRAVLLPFEKGARLHLVHVLPANVPEKLEDVMERQAEMKLESLRRQVHKEARQRGIKGVEVTALVRRGEPFVEIIRASRTLEADLIVLGRHGRRPLRDMFIGSTAERVIRKGEAPVLVVSGRAFHPYRRPLLAVGLDAASEFSLALMRRVLGPGAGSATLVHAFNIPFEDFLAPAKPGGREQSFRKEYRTEADSRIRKFLASERAAGLEWDVVLRAGDARALLIKEAVRRQSDLIVLGTHARQGLAHALLGSVAEWVVTTAPCDVLVGRPTPVEFQLP